MHLYDQLLEKQKIENAYTHWATYRYDLTKYLLSAIPPNSHIAIIGAGRCNDIDLELLAVSCKEVTLIDKEMASMQDAAKMYKDLTIPIHLLTKDVVGIDANQYRDFINKLVTEIRKKGLATDIKVLTDLAHRLLDQYLNLIPDRCVLGDSTYDFVIAIGLHSQLLSTLELIWSLLLQTINQEEETFRTRIIALNTFFVKRLNDALIGATKKNLLIGYECSRVGRTGTIQGAYQCGIDLKARIDNQTLTEQSINHLIWPFAKEQGIAYEMIFRLFEKEG